MTAALISLLLFAPLTAGAINKNCAKSIGVQPDKTIHGRLAIYNGGYPNLRLWEVGTHHLLGIYGDSRDYTNGPGDSEADRTMLPGNVEKAMDADDVFAISLFGDFVVRPLARFKAGPMQPACIMSAMHLNRQMP